MIILDDIPKTNKEIEFIDFIENIDKETFIDMFSKSILKESVLEDVYRSSNNINTISYIISRYSDESGLEFYYNVYDKTLTRKLIYGKCTYKMVLPYEFFRKKNYNNIYKYTDSIYDQIFEFIKNNLSDTISNTTNLILKEGNKTFFDGLLPEDMSESDVIESYKNLREKHKVKVSDIYLSDDDISRLNKYCFNKIKNEQKIPSNFKYLKKFLKSDDMEFIVINSVLQPFIDAVNNKDYEFIKNNESFFKRIINEFRIFSKKSVKLKYDELVQGLIDLNSIKTNNFLVKLDFNLFLPNTTRKPFLEKYNYDVYIIEENLRASTDPLNDNYISDSMLKKSNDLVLFSFSDIVMSINYLFSKPLKQASFVGEGYFYRKFLEKNNYNIVLEEPLYTHIVNIIDSYMKFDKSTNNNMIYKNILKNISKSNDFIDISDIKDPYTINIKTKKTI